MNIEQIMQSYDFSLVTTGGNCTAYQHIDEDGYETLITVADDPSAPTSLSDACTVSFFTEDKGEPVQQWETNNVPDALHAAKWYVMEYLEDLYHVINR